MKKTFLSILCVSILMNTFLLSSCKKDEPSLKDTHVISGTIVSKNPTLNIDSIYAVAEGDNTEIIGKSKLSNKTFNLNLKAPDNNTLSLITKSENFEGLNISNKNVKGSMIEFQGIKGGQMVDMLICGKTSFNLTGSSFTANINAIMYLYLDAPVKITGTKTETKTDLVTVSTYDLNLVKGWNIINSQSTASAVIQGENIQNLKVNVSYNSVSSIPTGYEWKLLSEINGVPGFNAPKSVLKKQ